MNEDLQKKLFLKEICQIFNEMSIKYFMSESGLFWQEKLQLSNFI